MSSVQEGPSRPDLMGELKFKIPLPIVIPLAALVVIAGLTIGFSRILLALPKEGATIVAIAMAANVLGASAFVAYRRRMSQTTWFELVAVMMYPVVIGVAIAAIGFGEGAGEHGAAEEHGAPAAGGLTSSVTAEGVAFTTDTITLPADEAHSLEFTNEDTAQHNIAIYASAKDGGTAQRDPLFDGAEFAGPATRTYEIGPLEAGSYFFQCDIHPDMNGNAEVE